MPRGEFDKIRDGVMSSHKELETARAKRFLALRQYVGTHYSTSGSTDEVPVNLIELGVNIFTQHLVPKTPQASVSTPHLGFIDSAEEFEYALNEMVLRIELEETLRMAVVEAMFGMGIVKVGVTNEDRHEFDGFLHDGNLPFADSVDFDDWVHDTTSRRWDQSRFFGNKYEISIEDLESNPSYDKAAVKSVKDSSLRMSVQNEASSFSQGNQSFNEENERVWLWDIWVPSEQQVWVFGCEDPNKPLTKIDWEGPENGPYHKLGFTPVPNNILPLSPVSQWMPMHDLTNKLYNKLGEQAARQKTITVAAGPADDARRTVNARDGEVVRISSPDSIREVRYGGADQNTLTFAIHAVDRFSTNAGNLEVLGGLGAQADTLGQERLLASSASQRVLSMQHNVVKFTREIMRDIGWWIWNNPLIQIPIVRAIKGTDIQVQTNWPYQIDGMGGEVDVRKGEYNNYNIRIEPHNLTELSPGEKLNLIRQVWQRDVLPIAPMLEAQGKSLDAGAYLEMVAKYSHAPEVGQLVVENFSAAPTDKPAVERTRQAPNTTRTHVRKDVSQKPSMGEQMLTQMMNRPQSDSAA